MLFRKTNEEEIMKNSFNYDELIQCAKGETYGIENGKLPLPNMLMMDRITNISLEGGEYGKGIIEAELDIHDDLWFFHSHFVGDPVMPGCLGLDALWQLIGFFLIWQGHKGKGRALGCSEVKFTGQILPHNKLVKYQIDIKRVFNSKLIMVVGDGKVFCDGEHIYTAKDLKVGLFNN